MKRLAPSAALGRPHTDGPADIRRIATVSIESPHSGRWNGARARVMIWRAPLWSSLVSAVLF